MFWYRSHRADIEVLPIADRHYNRQKKGTNQFVPPGRCLVLKTKDADAFWVTSWPYKEYARHAWGGAWVCSAFRNESNHLSSQLVSQAVACSLSKFGNPPDLGMVTFVNKKFVRKKRDWGRCFRKAGFDYVGQTKGGLVVLQLLPCKMPTPEPALKKQLDFFD